MGKQNKRSTIVATSTMNNIKNRTNRSSSFKKKQRSASRFNRKKGRSKSQIDPQLLIKNAVAKQEVSYISKLRIADLPIDPRLIKNLIKKGFERPTEIQEKTLQALLSGRDLLGIAKTGTGKTGAFLIPVIEGILLQNSSTVRQHALIVVPTRELAMQVEEEFKSMTKNLGLLSACFIGGTRINRDIQNLKRPKHIIIGTPGRLLDLYQRKAIEFKNIPCLILDEFDRMLDMGFARDMDRIINAMNCRRQTILFSATLDKTQKGRIDRIVTNAKIVKVSNGESSADHVEQDIVRINNRGEAFDILCEMLEKEEFTKVLVFDETKYRVKNLCRKLNNRGIKSDQIQGNKSQSSRQSALKAFREGKIHVLVATDVAARGIDIDDISHVINYQLPKTYDTYIHRIGRTGRAGKFGKALTFID